MNLKPAYRMRIPYACARYVDERPSLPSSHKENPFMPRKVFAPLVAGCTLALLVLTAGGAGSAVNTSTDGLCGFQAPGTGGGVGAMGNEGTLDGNTGYCVGFQRDCSGFGY